MHKQYSQDAVNRFIAVYDRQQEAEKLNALHWFELGRIIFVEVLQGQRRGTRNTGALESFRQDLAKSGRELSIRRLHDYKHLFLGANSVEYIETGIPAKYFQEIGKICDDASLTAMALAGALRKQPFKTDDGDFDYWMLDEVGQLIEPCLRSLAWNPPIVDLMDRKLIEPQGEALLLHVVTGGRNPETIPLTKEEREQLETTLEQLAGLETRIGSCIKEDFFCTFIGGQDTSGDLDWDDIETAFSLIVLHKGETLTPRPSSEKEKLEFTSAKAALRDKRWDERIDAAQKHQTPEQMRFQDERVFHGRAEQILLDGNLFLPHSLDAIITDPPYGDDYYAAWREHTAVDFDSPKTAEEAARLVAEVARVIRDRQLFKTNFAWLQFMPLNAVHIFIPPLLEVFPECRYQLWIWDKGITPKIGSDELATPRLEGIAYLTNDRPLAKTIDGQKINLYDPLFRFTPPKDGDNWKPVKLIRELVKRVTFGDEDTETARQQIILDPFAGAGGTGVAAIQCHRDFRLIESHRKQYGRAVAQVLESMTGVKHGHA